MFNESLIVVTALAIKTFFDGYNVFKDPIFYLSMDEDELKHGSRREGMFFGMNALFVKPANSLGPILATIILGAFGFIQGGVTQPPSALVGLKILLFLIPAIVSTIAIIIMYFHPLHGKVLEEMRENLEKLHSEKRERIV